MRFDQIVGKWSLLWKTEGFLGNLHPIVARTVSRAAFSILAGLALFMACKVSGSEVRATGPLRVCPANPRYFTDNSGNAVYLTGSHTWNNFQDSEHVRRFDYRAYLTFLFSHHHNFFRLWHYEQAQWFGPDPFPFVLTFAPLPFVRTGPGLALDGGLKFNLELFNQSYFDRMRQRIIEAGERGIYVSIMLFNGFSVDKPSPYNNPWNGHPFNVNNNINGIDGDPNQTGKGTEVQTLLIPSVIAVEEAYVRKIVDTVNDLDNVLYEICNESDTNSATTAWQYYMINYIKSYEAGRPKQHPVGMTAEYPGGNNSDLLASPADWISPNQGGPYVDYYNDPPAADGTKVILADTDHICGICGDRFWVWKSFLRGLNPIYMDAYEVGLYKDVAKSLGFNATAAVDIRKNLGYARGFAQKIGLTATLPRGDLSSTGYCLGNVTAGRYLVYLPSGGAATVDLTASPGKLSVEWFSPARGVAKKGHSIDGGAPRSFTSPFPGDAVLYIFAG